MFSFKLQNLAASATSSLSLEEITAILQSELQDQPLVTLREIARIIQVSSASKKAELVTELKCKIAELRNAPLSIEDLRLEADKKGISHFNANYRELRVLLGYEIIVSAGIIYYLSDKRDDLQVILSTTLPGTCDRLTRLKADQSAVQAFQRNSLPSHEPALYRLLFTSAIALTAELAKIKILYLREGCFFSQMLHETVPGSLNRYELLRNYDAKIIEEWYRYHREQIGFPTSSNGASSSSGYEIVAGVKEDLPFILSVLRIVVVLPSLSAAILTAQRLRAQRAWQDIGDEELPNQHYYTESGDELSACLSISPANSLHRYVLISRLEQEKRLGSLEELCSSAQIEDQRPHRIRDYLPSELETLHLKQLVSLACKEGVSPLLNAFSDHRNILIEALQIAYCSPTFIRTNLIRNSLQRETCLLTPLDEVPEGQLYAYGIRDDSSKFLYYERDELKGKFFSDQSFTDPRGVHNFELSAIKRLLVCAQNDESPEGLAFRTLITSLINASIGSNLAERYFIQRCSGLPEIAHVIKLLFQAGFYMRRWDGDEGKYPLKSVETEADPALEAEVEEAQLFNKINQALERLRCACDELPTALRELFWGLRLKNYRRDGYYSSVEEEDGITIRDRFQIVCQGNQLDAPISSCVRLTSGWFVFSAMYYNNLLTRVNLSGVRAHEVEFVS